MSKTNLLNTSGQVIGEVELNDSVWNIEVNNQVLHDAVVLANASLRQGTHSTKTRSEVRGGGRKPFKQKGTGNARQGTINAPQFRHGGVAFGPSPRNYSIKMNRKERRLALKSALTYKNTDNQLLVLDDINLETNKTSGFIKVLENLKIEDKKILLVTDCFSEEILLASRNLRNVELVDTRNVSVLSLLKCNRLVITKDALKEIEEVLVNA